MEKGEVQNVVDEAVSNTTTLARFYHENTQRTVIIGVPTIHAPLQSHVQRIQSTPCLSYSRPLIL
jgi:hypothetical protein